MSEEAPPVDLSALDFAPAWVKQTSAPPVAREFRESRAERPAERPDREGKAPHSGFKRGGPPRKDNFRRGPQDRPNFSAPRQDERPVPPPNPFPWLRIAFTATPPAVETVVKQVCQTGKTYSLFDIARILLRNPSSYTIDLTSAPKPPEGPFHVAPDGSVWMSRESAAGHILRTRLEDFYRAETVEIEPPKGNFTAIAVCGMSGVLLGPTNLHDYEFRLRALHRERFSRLDFETLRSRVKMERDPEIIEKWRASMSKVVHYFPKEGENPEKLENLAAVGQHFLDQHAAALIRFESSVKVPGEPKNTRVDAVLAPLLNYAKGEEERFPLKLAQSLSRALSEAGLRFHKSSNRTTFVSVARPRHLNLEETAVSDSIKKIIELVRGKKSVRRQELLDVLAPLPPSPSETAPPGAVPSSPESSTEPTLPVAAPSPAPNLPASPVTIIPLKTPEEAARAAVMQDLLWLTHEGYVTEYADSRLESVPPPKNPPKPATDAQPTKPDPAIVADAASAPVDAPAE